jgi:hypothetical protein
MENKVDELQILKSNFPNIYNVLEENNLHDQSVQQMLKEIKEYQEFFTKNEDYVILKLVLKGETPKNLSSRSKLLSMFQGFHQSLIENKIEDITFQEMMNDFEDIKEIIQLNEKDAQTILKVLKGEDIEQLFNTNVPDSFIDYLMEKNVNLPNDLLNKLIKFNLKNEELKNLKIGDIMRKFELNLIDSKEFMKVIEQCII